MIPSLRDQKLINYSVGDFLRRNRREILAKTMPLSRKSHANGIRKNGSTNLPSGATEDPITAYATTQAKLPKTEKIAIRFMLFIVAQFA